MCYKDTNNSLIISYYIETFLLHPRIALLLSCSLYFQIIHNRIVRQLNTDYKVLAEEWDAESESVIVNGNRSNLLLGIQERLAWDVARLEKVVRSLETERLRFTADDVIAMFHKLTKESVKM